MALNVFGTKEVDARDLSAMRAETDGFEQLTEGVLHDMSAAALDSHVALANRADAPDNYMEIVYQHIKDMMAPRWHQRTKPPRDLNFFFEKYPK